MYNNYLKRIIDVICSIILIILLSWLLIIISLLIKLTSKGRIIYKQKRIGKDKKEFYILKYRTMKLNAPRDVPTHLLQQPENYITGIGKVLRKTSLDELPQLFNILKGDMSFVGPRPALWNQYDLIAERELFGVNKLRPGLTGWAQVNGRDEIPISLKTILDTKYAKNISFSFDVYCIVLTVSCLFTGKGYREGKVEERIAYEESTSSWSQ